MFQFCRVQRVPLVTLTPIVLRHQAEDESFVLLKIELHSRVGHVGQDHLVLPHASTKCQIKFCIQRTLINFINANFS